MKWELFKKGQPLLRDCSMRRWVKSLEELLAGISAKYKGLAAISWLNVHRLYDFRRLQYLRLRLFRWSKAMAASRHKNLNTSERHNRAGESESNVWCAC